MAVETGIGWLSEGVTIGDCITKLETFKANAKTGSGGATTMKEQYSADAAKKMQAITIRDFIEKHYLQYSQTAKSPG